MSAMIYKFVAISSEDDSFLREFELDEKNTLLDFHNIIQEELEYDKSQLASFFSTTDKWEKEEEFTLFDMGATTTLMDEVIIDDIIINENQNFIYVFDLFNERVFFIENVGTAPEIEGREYPLCTNSHGTPPPQIISSGSSDFSGIDISDDDYSDNDILPDEESDLPDFENIDDFEEI